jgi:hypothetical protein
VSEHRDLQDSWTVHPAIVHLTLALDDLVKARGVSGGSSSQVSRRRGKFNERASAFLNRQIDVDGRCLWVHAARKLLISRASPPNRLR